METAAGVIAVVSLAIQLAESIKSLCEFWDNVKDAPKDIRDLVEELRLLQQIVLEIKAKEQQLSSAPPDDTLKAALQNIETHVTALRDLTTELEPGLASGNWRLRTWKSFKVSFKSDQLQKFRISLGEAKTTLLLARLGLNERIQYETKDSTITAIQTGFANLKLERSVTVVNTVTQDVSGLETHIQDLRGEMRQMLDDIPPLLRRAMRAEMDDVVQKLTRRLTDDVAVPSSPKVEKAVATEQQVSAHGETQSDTYGIDIEKDGNDRRGSDDSIALHRQRHLSGRNFHGSYAAIQRGFFGTTYVTTQKFYIEDAIDDSSSENSALSDDEILSRRIELQSQFTFYPAAWLVRLGLRYGLTFTSHRLHTGWKNTIRTFRPVPDNALIFEFVKTGNLAGVQSLLKRGDASPLDTNHQGWMPLHFAAWNCDIPMINLLIKLGADRKALTFDFPAGNYEQCSPLVVAATIKSSAQIPAQQRIDSMRLLVEDLDFADHEGQAWKMILVLLERERRSTGLSHSSEVSKWLLDTFFAYLQDNHSDEIVAWLLTFCLEDVELVRRVLNITRDKVHAVLSEGALTAVHAKIAEKFPSSTIPGIKLMLERGFDPHRTAAVRNSYGSGYQEIWETPTSIAMRRSESFFRWRQILRELKYDMPNFVANELKQCPLRERGWTDAALLKLFRLDFQPYDFPQTFCAQCGRIVYDLYSRQETWWDRLLERIRCNPDTNVSAEDCFMTDQQEEENLEDDDALCWKCGIMRNIYGEEYQRGLL